MDHRQLLSQYIQHVGACEGVNFLENDLERYSHLYGVADDPHFTAEEWKELQLLAAAVDRRISLALKSDTTSDELVSFVERVFREKAFGTSRSKDKAS